MNPFFQSISPQVRFAEVGDRVTLKCNAFGNPKPQIRWMRSDFSRLPNGDIIYKSNFLLDSLHIKNNKTLQISSSCSLSRPSYLNFSSSLHRYYYFFISSSSFLLSGLTVILYGGKLCRCRFKGSKAFAVGVVVIVIVIVIVIVVVVVFVVVKNSMLFPLVCRD